MKNTTITNKLIQATNEAIKVFDKYDETDIAELDKSKGFEIYNLFYNSFKQYHRWDGDADSGYNRFIIKISDGACINVLFVSSDEYNHGIHTLSVHLPKGVSDNSKTSREALVMLLDYLNSLVKSPTEIINLTPHTINVCDDNGDITTSYPSTGVARVDTNEVVTGSIDDVNVVETEYQGVTGLPEPKDNTVYVVSILVLQALNGTRSDVVAPNTSPKSCVRDDKGQIVGVKSFTVI